jgi:hypothetical protein
MKYSSVSTQHSIQTDEPILHPYFHIQVHKHAHKMEIHIV